ncbi:PREDICTED: ribonuclease P protein subunit p29 [Papilio xuthus]|uniref:Ribonuclease P protein subunit p29 n=1 Tax=Papilio xuthus TaxID=66420 RepID=A0A194PPV7_PAPXU|nr:PREDICTED: ribonuclease P protein subunit p29 [Papilio xuthus]KPI93165.1 Ribonuclease P protein subunit p29 [Papilio xuthus]
MDMADNHSNDGRAVINFLKNNVYKLENATLEAEMKKDFLFAKKKSKDTKKKQSKKKSQTLTRKEKKAMGFYNIPRNGVRYNDVLPMNDIWEGYISELLELDKPVPECNSKCWEHFAQTLYRADFHGSLLEVIRSKCPSYVGKKGICIMDTRNTFKIVSINNVVTTIPKRECVFDMYINDMVITFFGKHLCIRPAERSTKKIKCVMHPDL